MSLSNQLTTIAALPGSGGGCAAALKPEVVAERRKPAIKNGVTINLEFKPLSADVQKLIAQQLAESMRRTLLRLAGAA